jgi:MarR family transcriptional regulator, organic hydroperoxide resistance regulator
MENNNIKANSSFLIWQISNVWKKEIRSQLKKLHLTYVQYILLAGLQELQTRQRLVTQIQLSQYLNCGSMVTSMVLRNLKAYGFLKIKTHPKDTRAKILKITPAGNQTLVKARKIMSKFEESFFSPISGMKSKLKSLVRTS